MQSHCPAQDRAAISTQWATWTKYIKFCRSHVVTFHVRLWKS